MRKLSNKQEKKIAEDLGGKVVVNSGATKWKKGDVSTDDKKIEAKITTKGTYSVKFEDLIRIRTQAIKDNCKEPVFIFEFKDKAAYAITFISKDSVKKDIVVYQTLKSMPFEYHGLELTKEAARMKNLKGPLSYFGFKYDDREYYCAVWDYIDWLQESG